jgi:hypothetical protein
VEDNENFRIRNSVMYHIPNIKTSTENIKNNAKIEDEILIA